MVRNLFALASAIAVAGIVSMVNAVGCTSGGEAVGGARVTDDAGDTRDAGKREVPPPTEYVEKETCALKEKVDLASIRFQPPRILPGACSADDLEFFRNATVGKAVSLVKLEEILRDHSTTCAACVFGRDGDTWAPFVDLGDRYVVNVGGCVAVATKNVPCGKAYHVLRECQELGCSQCKTSVDQRECFDAVQADGGACAEALATYDSECGSSSVAYEDECGLNYVAARLQCGETPDDGGDGG